MQRRLNTGSIRFLISQVETLVPARLSVVRVHRRFAMLSFEDLRPNTSPVGTQGERQVSHANHTTRKSRPLPAIEIDNPSRNGRDHDFEVFNSRLQPETSILGLRIRLALPRVRSAVSQAPGLQDGTAENLGNLQHESMTSFRNAPLC